MGRPQIRLKTDKQGNAVILEGQDTFVGKLIASKGSIKINTPLVKSELKIVSKLPKEQKVTAQPKKKKASKKK